jgi:hypothetical protein
MLSLVNGDVALDSRPCLSFGRGRSVRHIFDNTFEWLKADGSHERYLVALPIVYEPTLEREFYKQLRPPYGTRANRL